MVILFCQISAFAQISPGDLTAAHEHLEGLSNCTLCHTLGDKVSNQKCLDCHDYLDQRITSGLGYHASSEVKGKDCFSCHSEHHGRNFEMIRFNKDDFDHSLTGYRLEGAHKRIDCRECHTSDNIFDSEIREIEDTYLGLTTECLLCHQDYHQNTLSPKCINCHNFEAFEPAANFNHNDDTEYALTGKHVDVDCIKCHEKTIRDGREFQDFSGISSSSCASCHEDVHASRLGQNCKACHTETGFDRFTGGAGFDHGITSFPLRGAHARQDCKSCHDISRGYTKVFSDHDDEDPGDCRICHEDVHEGRFGINCRDCHNERSWKIGQDVDNFDHDLTDFHLEGKHTQVDCRDCHISELTDPLDFDRCLDCHDDYHKGRLVSDVNEVDCQRCHTVYGFEKYTFNVADHGETAFPLTGAHLAIPCFMCHQIEEEEDWIFDELGVECLSCHENVHEGSMDPKYYEAHACTYCHTTESWQDIDFDHDQTEFRLEGQHELTKCGDCHIDATTGEQIFEGLTRECYICHDDIHRGQFDEDGITNCENCHSPLQWQPSLFNHDSTAFPLQGAHASVDCRECHLPEMVDGDVFFDYHIESFECVDCHL